MLEIIETVLENNNFQLGCYNYLQRDGIAIGSRLGKNFACSYMRQWDEELLKFGKTSIFYKRFTADGFGIWSGTLNGLMEFTEFVNSIHGNIFPT